MTNLLWRYTKTVHRHAIGQLGVLRGTSINDFDKVPFQEPKGVWFSNRQVWEPTAAPGNGQNGGFTTMAKAHEVFGLTRFGIDPKLVVLLSFREYVKRGCIPSRYARALAKSAERVGSDTCNWWVSLAPVPRSQWISVQTWDGQRWVDDPINTSGLLQPLHKQSYA